MSSETLWKAPPSTFISTLSTFISSFFIIGSVFWLPVAILVAWRKCKSRKSRFFLFLAILGLFTIPMPASRTFKNAPVWMHFMQYFNLTVKGSRFRNKQSMFAFSPHGLFPFALAIPSLAQLNSFFLSFRPIVASVTTKVPILGHVIKGMGAVEADVKKIDEVLKEGRSVGIAPGGIAEMFWTYPRPGTSPSCEYVILENRKGFVRLAMEHGLQLVPIFVFGSSKAFYRWDLPLLERLSRWIRASLVLFWGRMGLPIPLPVQLLYAVGKSIQLQKMPNPSKKEVELIHSRFCQELTLAFEKHKHEYGWGDKTLKIV